MGTHLRLDRVACLFHGLIRRLHLPELRATPFERVTCHVELLAMDDVVYADEGSALDPDYEGAKYARGAQAAGAMPEE